MRDESKRFRKVESYDAMRNVLEILGREKSIILAILYYSIKVSKILD